MRKPLISLAVATLVFTLVLSGCGIVYKQPIYQGSLVEQAAVDQLQPGMSKQQVLALLGTPSIADPFHDQRWDYTSSQRTGRTGQTEIRNLILYFQNDTLTEWDGDYFAEQDEELARELREAFGPNLARDDEQGRR